MKRNRNSAVMRLRLVIGELRQELQLTHAQAAKVSRLSAATVARIENGGVVSDAAIVQLGSALFALAACQPPAVPLDDDLAAFVGRLTHTEATSR